MVYSIIDGGCHDPCGETDCGPGTCELTEHDRARCNCPAGFEAVAEPPGCREKTDFAWELVYEVDGQAWVMGHAWLSSRRTGQGLQVEASTSFLIPVSYDGDVGGDLRTVARIDEDGELVEFVQDQQAVFGRHTARRRLHVKVERTDDGQALLLFWSNILDRIWHGEIELTGRAPIPMADAFEYPTFSYGCFDPFFYFALGRAVDLAGPEEQTLAVMAPSFVIPFELAVTKSGDADQATVAVESYGVEADFHGSLLTRVRYGWCDWREADAGAPLEINMRPLPVTPIEHESAPLPECVEQEVEFVSDDSTVLAGTLSLPAGATSRTAVLLAPDLVASARDKSLLYMHTYHDLAARLAAGGYASLRFDGRGTGASQGESTADPGRLVEDLWEEIHLPHTIDADAVQLVLDWLSLLSEP